MQTSTDYLTEHGFVETECHECHELVILPREIYQKYVVYYCTMCEPHQPIYEKLWATYKLAIVLGGVVGPLTLGSTLGIVGLVLSDWTIASIGGAMLLIWCAIATLVLVTAAIVEIVKNPGSY